VTGVVGRADVEACFFFIVSFLAYIKSHKAPTNTSLNKQTHTWWLWLLLCFVMSVASMLSKEQGITVLGVCAVYEILILFSCNKKQTLYVTLTKVSLWYILLMAKLENKTTYYSHCGTPLIQSPMGQSYLTLIDLLLLFLNNNF